MHPVRKLVQFAVICAIVAPLSAAYSQANDIGQLLSGKSAPLTMTLKSLDSSWRTFSVQTNGGYEQVMSAMMGGGAGNLYTKGDTIAAGNDVYLIAYKPHQNPIDWSAMMRGGRPKAPALTADSTLDLSLLNLHALGSLNGIRVFNLQDELDASNKQANAMQQAYGSAQAVVTTGTPSKSTSESNLRNIGLGLIMFNQDYDGKYPSMKDFAAFQKSLLPYTKSKDVFVQPGVNKHYGLNRWLNGKTSVSIDDPAGMITLYEVVPDKIGRRWVGYADGHVKQITAAQWAAQKKASHIR